MSDCVGSVLFEDTFDGEGNPRVPTTSLLQWDVISGSVDVIGSGPGGSAYDFFPGNGYFLDTDGSSAGTIRTKAGAIGAQPAGDYRLRFELGGSTRGETNQVQVTVFDGPTTFFQETFTLASGDPLAFITRDFTIPAAATPQISVAHLSASDARGLILDDVALCSMNGAPVIVPELGAVLLLGTGLVGLGALAVARTGVWSRKD